MLTITSNHINKYFVLFFWHFRDRLPRIVLKLMCGTLIAVFSSHSFSQPRSEYAIPEPERPRLIYRADLRPPQEIFRTGFVTRARAFYPNDIPNSNLISHVRGDSHNSNWISATDDFSYARAHGISGAIEPLTANSRFYIYSIQPDSSTISVVWAFLDYVARNRENRDLYYSVFWAEELVRNYGHQREWAHRESISTSAIVNAVSVTYNPGTGEWIESPVARNPYYVPEEPSINGIGNPVDNFFPQMEPSSSRWEAVDDSDLSNGTWSGGSSPTLSCTGVAYPAFSSRSNTGSSCSLKIKKTTVPTTYIPSKLPVSSQNAVFCLTPKQEVGYVGVDFISCSSSNSTFEYDELRRISTKIGGNYFCLTAPASTEKKGANTWDYARFEPCVLNSTLQHWTFKNSSIISQAGNALQQWRKAGIISNNADGYKTSLVHTSMPKGFFQSPSPSRSELIELGFAWSWGTNIYYSNFNSTQPWSSTYWNRSYYDTKTRRISYMDLGSIASGKYCLSSRQYHEKTEWNWTKWMPCTDSEPGYPLDQKWFISPYGSQFDPVKFNPKRVSIKDYANNYLWANASGSNAGFYFTGRLDKDYKSSAVNAFELDYQTASLIARYR